MSSRLSCAQGRGEAPLAWSRSYGAGRVFYTALGHEKAVWRDFWFQKLLRNSALWVLRRELNSSDPVRPQ
jgi:type 1 glutamine amidotransferase